MSPHLVLARALVLAEEFLAGARAEITVLAAGDLDQLRGSATALRAAAAGRSSAAPKGAEQIAYLVVASAFNQALAAREERQVT